MATYHIRDIDTKITGSQKSGKSDLTISRKMFCTPYTGVPTLMGDLLGGYKLVSGRVRVIPSLRHPLFPWTRCSDVSVEGHESFGYVPNVSIAGKAGLLRTPVPVIPSGVTDDWGNTGVGSAIVTATYTLPTLPEKEAGGGGDDADQQMDIASESWDFGGQRLTQLNEYLRWVVSGRPKRKENFLVTKTLTELRCQLVRHRVIRMPAITIGALQDTINKSQFRIVNTILPPETVRFEGASASRRITTSQGLQFYEVTYKFAIRLIVDYTESSGATKTYVGWNRIYNPEKGWWERMVNFPIYSTGSRGIYLYDEDIYPASTQPNAKPIRGMQYLFDPRAL